MTAFNKSFTAVFLALIYASVSQAIPFDQGVKHATHRTREICRSLKVEVFHPPTSYSTFGDGVYGPLLRGGDLKSQIIAAVRQRLGVDESSVTFKSGYSQSSEAFGYVKQQHEVRLFLPTSYKCRTRPRMHGIKRSSTPIPGMWSPSQISWLMHPGNNVVAYKGSQSSLTKESSEGHVYTYVVDPDTEPNTTNNLDAARTNAFYVSNMIHDITYLYGFTEAAYNFQNTNFDKGGKAGDKVLMSVQDSSGTNNANFATPPDGQSGRCRMYLWTMTTPRRDGSFENDIIAHELTHGLTNRMTGGGTGRCLQTTEAGGMGEGWSDAFADWLWQKNGTIQDYKLGWYVYKPEGIRAYPYSTDPAVNPLKYSNVKGNYAVHSIGTVWANMLHNVHAALLAAHGYSETAFTNPDADADAGNVVFMRLFIDALAIQPCNPTFVNARDAWIQADANRYGGTHKCLIWKVFASKGLGVNADKFVDNFDVPTECKDSAEEGAEPEDPEVPEVPEEETISPDEAWL